MMGEFEKRFDEFKNIIYRTWAKSIVKEARREFPYIQYDYDISDEYAERLSKWIKKWFGE